MSIFLCSRVICSVSVEDLVLIMMHLWCVLLILPVLVAESLTPGDGCGLNTTVVAGVGPPETEEFQYSTSIVSTGERDRVCVPRGGRLGHVTSCDVYWAVILGRLPQSIILCFGYYPSFYVCIKKFND